MNNKLMTKRNSILDRILSRFKRQRTKLESNIELYNFLKERYSEEKRIMGIIPVIVFGQEQLDKITGLDISGEDYIKSLKGIDELRNLKELYCRLGIEFDYDSVCEALSIEQLQAKRLSIKSPEQLEGYNLAKLPTDVMIVGYDCTKKYHINDGVLLENKDIDEIQHIPIIFQSRSDIQYEDCSIPSERQEEYENIMNLRDKVRNGEVSYEDVEQLISIAFGEGSTESKQILNTFIKSGMITTKDEKKHWKLDPEERRRIQDETAEYVQNRKTLLTHESTGERIEQDKS